MAFDLASARIETRPKFDLASAKKDAPTDGEAAPEMSVGQRAIAGAGTLAAGLATSPADVGLSITRQAVAFPASGLAGLAGAVLPGPPGQGAEFVQKTQEAIGGQPFTAAGRAAIGGLGETMRPAIEAARAPGSALAEQGIPALGIEPSQATRVAGAVLSGVPEALAAGTPLLRGRLGGLSAAAETTAPYKKSQLGLPQQPDRFADSRMTPEARRQSMGAAQTPDAAMVQASIDEAPQAVRTALQGVPVEDVQTTALDRHAKASSLPAPVPLTWGMATADSALFSEERNLRAKLPALAERLDQYPQLFQENFTLLRDSMAPDIFGEPTANNLGKDFIKLYQTHDKNLTGEIGAAYGDVKAAMGGREMMVDTSDIASRVNDELKLNRSLRWLPEEFKAELADMTERGAIPFDEIDKLQSVLGRAIKGYGRQGKGNEAYAAGIFQRQLADMQFVGEVGEIKTLADRARGLARARFQLIEADPAFASVVKGTARADKFVDKHITTAGEGGAARVLQTLAGTDAQQLAKLALLKKLDDKTGTMAFAPGDRTQSRNMTAAGYDRTFRGLKDSGVLDAVYTPEEAAQLNTLGEVMRYTQQTGSGGYVNYSGTTVSAASDVFREQAGAVGAAATDAALQSVGVPAGVVKFGKGVISTLANRRFVKDSLEPFAGIRRKGKPGEPPAAPPPTTPPAGPPPSGPPPSGPSGPPPSGPPPGRPSGPTLRNTPPQGRGQRGAITLGGTPKPKPIGTAPTLSQLPENQKLGQLRMGRKQRGSIGPKEEFLKAYHGTNDVFEIFNPKLTRDIGMHFGTESQAAQFGKHIMPVHLDIRNPLLMEDVFSRYNGLGDAWRTIDAETNITSAERDKLEEYKRAVDNKWEDDRDVDNSKIKEFKQFWKLAEKVIRRSGFDGIVYRNKVEGDFDSYVVFDPKQIKSAGPSFKKAVDPNNPTEVMLAEYEAYVKKLKDEAKAKLLQKADALPKPAP